MAGVGRPEPHGDAFPSIEFVALEVGRGHAANPFRARSRDLLTIGRCRRAPRWGRRVAGLRRCPRAAAGAGGGPALD